MNLAEKLSRYAANLTYDDLTPEAIHEAKRRVLDSLGCAMGARHAQPSRIARELALSVSASPGATVIGTTHKSAPDHAAFANGVLFRYLDFNDTYLSKEPAHPSDNIAAILAAAEVAGASGKDVILAIVLAYEVQCRLCDAYSIRAQGWDHVTYGAFSTSLACGKLLGLTEEQLTHAQGIAGTVGNAMRQTRVGMLSHWKGCAFANASRGGIFAAQLAKLGMTGPAPIFEGEMGFFNQVAHGSFSLDAKAFGPPFIINQTYIKFWPAEYHSQSAIDAALQLRDRIGDWREIAKIEIASFSAAVEIIGGEPEKWRPTTRETADHSLPYCVAVALQDGDVTLDSFDAAHLGNEALLDFIQNITVVGDAALNPRYPEGIPNRLTVTLKDGTQHVCEVTFPRGHARNPMSDSEVVHKFRSMARIYFPEDRLAEMVRRCLALENEASVTPLLELFA
ncbi:MmgE/PrpD family protein [Armatimonas sp.]|uniref:MmgE/PrpD family protein n=1 Tax=Armatimonas sp. TaxID=1872638 RepID=UPI003751C50E